MPEEANDSAGSDYAFEGPAPEPGGREPHPQPGPGGYTFPPPPPQRWIPADQADRNKSPDGGGDYGPSVVPFPKDPPPPGGGGGPGPPKKGGIASVPPAAAAPAHSIFDPYSGPQVDAARSIITNFMNWLGYPQSMDTNQMALWLLQNNLENKPGDAYEQLFMSDKFMTAELRSGNPWARYGMDADTFRVNLSNAQQTLKQLTGVDVSMVSTANADAFQRLLQDTVKNGWGQSQLMSILQSGEFTDISGVKAKLDNINETMPWIAAGQTYQSSQQQFTNIYGVPPANSNQLGAWFRFNQASSRLQTTQREAVQGAVDTKAVGTAVR